ncbi:MAG: hypothetical protein HWE07_13385 [Cytophagia bacterium]|nr:hypothetical protein [Cytophagia bacterium]
MKVECKGFDIEVTRERSCGGWSQLYFSIFRKSDGFECLSSFEDSQEKVSDKVKELKECIDNELKLSNPWNEEDLPF